MRKVSGAISLWNCLRAQGFSAVIYLAPSQRSPAQVLRDREFFEVCGIRRRLAFYAFDDAALHPQEVDGHPARVRHEALWRLERLRQDGIDVSVESNLDRPFLVPPPHELDNALLWLGQCRHWPARSLVAICPGAKQPTNLWPLDRFEEIGRRLLRQEAVELIVVGGKAERAIGARMVEVWGTGLNAAGEFSVLGSAALLGQCAFVIGLDTGTTHLAAAQGIPCVALYGERENPGRWEPLGQKHIVVRHRVLCAGCRIENASCPVKDHPCMTGITVDVVWQAVQQMLSRL
jgi:ADP-heptose:LPS heptosyltransferase